MMPNLSLAVMVIAGVAAPGMLFALLAVAKLTRQASCTVWVAPEVKVLCKTDVVPVAPDSRVFVVATAR